MPLIDPVHLECAQRESKRIVNHQTCPFMKVTTEMRCHEQKEKGETVKEANFARNLTDEMCTADRMFL